MQNIETLYDREKRNAAFNQMNSSSISQLTAPLLRFNTHGSPQPWQKPPLRDVRITLGLLFHK